MIAAFLITFFATPLAYRASVEGVRHFAEANYAVLTGVIAPLWFLIVLAVIGLLSTLLLKIVFSGGTLSVFRRFF